LQEEKQILRLGRSGLAQDFGYGLTFTPASAKSALAGDPEFRSRIAPQLMKIAGWRVKQGSVVSCQKC